MLTCLPVSLCSWDFRVSGTFAETATVAFNFFSEQGSISLGTREWSIRKHGPLSGHWTLEDHGQIVADATKPNALFRSFEVQAGDVRFTAKAQSAFTRSYDLLSGDRKLGTICPAHPFTRRSSIECAPEVPELGQLFAFWLAVITWRRAANNQAATPK